MNIKLHFTFKGRDSSGGASPSLVQPVLCSVSFEGIHSKPVVCELLSARQGDPTTRLVPRVPHKLSLARQGPAPC